MLHTIRKRADAPAAPDGPRDMLLACHVRLRHFSGLSLALARRVDLSREQRADARAELLRYFRIALPLHEADEEETLAPAIAPLATAAEVDAIARMCEEHARLDDVLAELFPLWEAEDASKLQAHAERLAALLEAHLALEEETIFPILERMPAGDLARIAGEFRARRAT